MINNNNNNNNNNNSNLIIIKVSLLLLLLFLWIFYFITLSEKICTDLMEFIIIIIFFHQCLPVILVCL
jgi:hypothetical protein